MSTESTFHLLKHQSVAYVSHVVIIFLDAPVQKHWRNFQNPKRKFEYKYGYNDKGKAIIFVCLIKMRLDVTLSSYEKHRLSKKRLSKYKMYTVDVVFSYMATLLN